GLWSARKQGSDAGLIPLAGSDQRRLWLRLLPMGEPSNPAGALARWHQDEAAASEQAQNWFAALFHWERAARLQPDNADLREALARVTPLARLSHAEGHPVRSETTARVLERAPDTDARLLDLSGF